MSPPLPPADMLPPLEVPPVELPPVELPPEDAPPVLPRPPAAPLPSSSPSLFPPHEVIAVAPASVAVKANVAARPSRRPGRAGAGVLARSSVTPQKGQAVSLVRTCLSQPGHG